MLEVPVWHLSSIHYFKMRNQQPAPITTILTITVGFLVAYIITNLDLLLWIAIAVGIVGLISPKAANIINVIWLRLATLLSLIVPNILLTIVFYFLLFPIAVLARVFRKKDSLNLKNNRASLFEVVNRKFDKKSFENPW